MTGGKFVCIFLLLLTLWISTCDAQGSLFGESCDKTRKCDNRAWLTCRNGSCDCMKPDVMMYEGSLGKCASKAGERCKFITEEFDNKNAVFEMISCIKNSKCSVEGFCVCDNKFYENLNGTCTRASSHMESCDSVVKCSKFESLQCTDGLCKCNETVSTYSNGESSDGQCVGLAGESCINSKCIENSACSSGNLCVCDDDYQDEDKLCEPKMSRNCTKNEQCLNFRGSQLTCHHGVCNCNPQVSRYGTARKSGAESEDFYSYGYYDKSGRSVVFYGDQLTQCLGLSASPCLDSLCVPNSYCDAGTCKCEDGFTKSPLGNCARSYDQSCTSAEDCIDGLICSTNVDSGTLNRHPLQVCRCPYKQQEFNSSTLTCMSKVDGPCDSLVSCVTNSECLLFSTEPFDAGHCSCKTGFIKNRQGKCDLAFGSPCLPLPRAKGHMPCDTVAGLVCLNFKCECHDFGKYSEKDRKCLGLVGADCDLNSTEPQCVENSQCHRVYPRLQGICTCPFGFKETPKYTCEVENRVSKKIPIRDEE